MLHFRMYYVIGWGVPVIMTTIWAVVTGLQIGSDVECWFGYSHIYSYFIVEGPRLTLITVSTYTLSNYHVKNNIEHIAYRNCG